MLSWRSTADPLLGRHGGVGLHLADGVVDDRLVVLLLRHLSCLPAPGTRRPPARVISASVSTDPARSAPALNR